MRDWSRVAIICGGRARTLPSQLQPVMPAKSWRAAAAGKIAINLLRVTISQKPCPAKVAELADAPDLGSGGETHGGSSPPFRTISPIVQLTQGSSAYRSGGRGSAPVEAFSWSLFCPNWAGLFLASFDFAGGFGQVRFADDVVAVEDRARFVAAYAFRDAATN